MIDVKPSGDPVPILLEPGDVSPFSESVSAGLVGLEYLAKQAFEERRRKQCLEITRAILKIKPEHADALTIQASVRSELDKDLANAQEVARNARLKSDPMLYGQATAVLRRIVDADPDNLEAQTLLRETVASGYFSQSSKVEEPRRKTGRRSIFIGVTAFLVLVAVLAFKNGSNSQALAQLPSAIPAVSVNSEPEANTVSLSDLPPVPSPEPPGPVVQIAAREAHAPAPLVSSSRTTVPTAASPTVLAAVDSVEPPVSALTGDLAVSAAVPVEIYRGEEHLGSTPITLQLPAGSQALEYRYQGLRQTLTHLIAAHQTTVATIAFSVKVQINAKPWAQVFLDGARLTAIGQTPLGDVSVPIGSVLVFQNPGYSDKRYRVTPKDAAIQVTFP